MSDELKPSSLSVRQGEGGPLKPGEDGYLDTIPPYTEDNPPPVGDDVVSLRWFPPTLAEWMAQVDVSKPWIIKHILPDDSLVLVSGQQKRAFKTWWAFLLALCVACGKKVGIIEPIKTGPVIIIEEEGSKAQTKQRFMMLCATLGIDWTKITNIYFAHRNRVKLDNEQWRQDLVALVQHVKPVFVLYDALSYAHTGDENSQADMSLVIDTMQSVRAQGCTMMILAHLDKQRGENKHADIDTQVRGASIVVNAYDTHHALRRYKMDDPKIDVVIRSRDDEERKYFITWDIKEPAEDGSYAGHAKMAFFEVIEGDRPADTMVDRCRLALETDPDAAWTLRRLRELWQCSEKNAKKLVEFLVKESVMMALDNGQYALAREKEEMPG